MTTRATLHRLVDALPNADLATAARVLAALAATRAGMLGTLEACEFAGPAGNHAVCLLSIPEACRRLGGISRDTFDRDRELRALVQPATKGRIGVREDLLDALIERRGEATRARAFAVPDVAAVPAGGRPYRRRHRRAASTD